jgi:hypothetical protein
MKKIRLTEDDYISIYPLAKPIEIKEEFGETSHCIAQIRNYYRKLRFDTQARALRKLKNELHLQKPADVGFREWEAHINEELEEKKREVFEKVHLRLKDRYRLYKGVGNG